MCLFCFINKCVVKISYIYYIEFILFLNESNKD